MQKENPRTTAVVSSLALSSHMDTNAVPLPDYDRAHLEDTRFMTGIILVMMGNYAQTGRFGGPLAYTPYTVTSHLVGPELGGLLFDNADRTLRYRDG